MIVMISLDISTTSTGYAVYGNALLIRSGVIIANNKSMTDRQMVMIEHIHKLFDEYAPVIVVAEEATPTRNAKVMRSLAMISGAAMGWCACHDAEFVLYKPSEWRKLVCNQGESVPFRRDEAKLWAVQKVHDMHGMNVNDDEAEAILIGQARINEFELVRG